VRGKAPERVFLAADFAEVETVRGYVLQFAQLTLRQKPLNRADAWMVLQQVANHQDEALLFGQLG
jgi:hypothetical protein